MPIFNGGVADAVGTVNKFQTPMLADGRMFNAAPNQIVAYTLLKRSQIAIELG
jgi:hypothetical protein